MTANHAHMPTDEEMQELFETGAMVTEFAHSRQEATIDWQLWLQERDARIEAAAEQRGAERALRNAANIKLGNEYYEMLVEDELTTRADDIARAGQMEGDDETH